MDLKDDPNVPQKNRTYAQSFKYAFKGVQTVFKEERNMRAHAFLGSAVLVLSLFLRLNRYEWAWILLSVFMVLVMEIWNTVAENLVDLTTDFTFHPIAKKVKDMAAAAVLLTAFFSTLVGSLIILPKVYQLLLTRI